MNTGASTGRPTAAAWTVLLGPGPRLQGLDGLVRAVLQRLHPGLSAAVGQAGDLAQLLSPHPDSGRLVLDGDQLPHEDLGLVRRFLAANDGWSLLVVGEDAGRRTARALLSLPRSGWLAWPPDLAQLEELVRAPAALAPRSPAGPNERAAPHAAAPQLPRLREQLDELSELARSCEASARALSEDAGGESAPLAEIGRKTARLWRNARALAYLAEPPRAGATPIDLGALLEDELAALTLRDREAARFLYRGAPGLEVRADREALNLALESLLLFARGAAPADEVVRVQLRAPEHASGLAEIRIEFPSGLLAGRSLEGLDVPHALGDTLPELGPNDLASARAVISAHGGTLELGPGREDGVEVSVRLPSQGAPVHAEAGPAAAGDA